MTLYLQRLVDNTSWFVRLDFSVHPLRGTKASPVGKAGILSQTYPEYKNGSRLPVSVDFTK